MIEPINWSSLARVWSCYENMGLSPLTLTPLLEVLESPILIVGGGGGLNVEFLQHRGFCVSAVDNSPEMIRYAKDVRGIPIDYWDGGELPYGDSEFKTVVIATGVINSFTLYQLKFDDLFRRIARVSAPGAFVYLGYFEFCSRLDFVHTKLGLNRSPSNNFVFGVHGSLAEVKSFFLDDLGFDRLLIDFVFDRYRDLMEAHFCLMQDVYKRLTMLSPEINAVEYMKEALAFDYFDMTTNDREFLLFNLSRLFSRVEEIEICVPDVKCIRMSV